jgi:nitrate/nitrite transporter NarK
VGAAAGIAAINALGNIGGFAAPTIKTWLEQTSKFSAAGLYFLGCSALLAAALIAVLPDSEAGPTGNGEDKERMTGGTKR